MQNVAVIGAGYWGINYVRILRQLPDSNLALVCDASEARLEEVEKRFPGVAVSTRWQDAIDSRIDAVVVATPASVHFGITSELLRSGKPVLVEKPLANSVSEATALVELAERESTVLMVGHTFVYNDGIRKVRELVSAGAAGRIHYLHATRTNMGPIRDDVGAVWDLAPHDVSIFNYILGSEPLAVSAVGSRPLSRDHEDIGFATLTYPDGVIANIHVSWLDPNKMREVVVVGTEARILFDDLNSFEKVRVFYKGVAPSPLEARSFGEYGLLLRDGDILSPHIPASEPLTQVITHFLECVRDRKMPISDGRSGLAVVKALAAIDESIRNGGAQVKIQ
jgi:predicted dehydrogenase